jgi:hypothetical protein
MNLFNTLYTKLNSTFFISLTAQVNSSLIYLTNFILMDEILF